MNLLTGGISGVHEAIALGLLDHPALAEITSCDTSPARNIGTSSTTIPVSRPGRLMRSSPISAPAAPSSWAPAAVGAKSRLARPAADGTGRQGSSGTDSGRSRLHALRHPERVRPGGQNGKPVALPDFTAMREAIRRGLRYYDSLSGGEP